MLRSISLLFIFLVGPYDSDILLLPQNWPIKFFIRIYWPFRVLNRVALVLTPRHQEHPEIAHLEVRSA